MCGIAGCFSWDKKVDRAILESMTDVLIHRGPDGKGLWTDDDQKIGFGHRRLSIIDLTEKGHQPMQYKGRYTITYNGEIYNYQEVRSLLEGRGHRFKSATDTEVILAAYDEYGCHCVDHFDGMFAFALWDDEKQELFCARDRFGEKPFYFHRNDKELWFASEMKALFKAKVPKTANLKRYYYYLLYNVAEDPNDKSSTFYQYIHQLEPAHWMTISSNGTMKKHKYWDVVTTTDQSISFTDASQKFHDLFVASVSRRLRSDVAIGSSLSGGLDSSSIVMTIDDIKGKDQIQTTFSARFRGYKKDEGQYMDRIIENANIHPFFIYPTAESVEDNLDRIFYHQEEPIGSLSVAVQYEVMQKAGAEDIKVLLDGQGADETLAGYGAYWEPFLLELYKKNRKAFKKQIHTYNATHSENPGVNNKEIMLRSYFPGLYNYLRNNRTKENSESSYFLGIHPDIVQQYKSLPNPLAKCDSLKEQLYFSTFKRGLGELLRYADRNSMAHSVEVRLPFLSHELVEFLFSLPSAYLMESGWTKYILRKSMEPVLPQQITWRKDKVGFEPPRQQWETSALMSDRIQDAIQQLQSDKIITKPRKEQYWQYLALSALTK